MWQSFFDHPSFLLYTLPYISNYVFNVQTLRLKHLNFIKPTSKTTPSLPFSIMNHCLFLSLSQPCISSLFSHNSAIFLLPSSLHYFPPIQSSQFLVFLFIIYLLRPSFVLQIDLDCSKGSPFFYFIFHSFILNLLLVKRY